MKPQGMTNSLASAGEDLSDLCRLLEDGTQALALAECALASVDHAAGLAASPSRQRDAPGPDEKVLEAAVRPWLRPLREWTDREFEIHVRAAARAIARALAAASPSTEGLTEEELNALLSHPRPHMGVCHDTPLSALIDSAYSKLAALRSRLSGGSS